MIPISMLSMGRSPLLYPVERQIRSWLSTQLNSTQFIDIWQLWSWIEQTQRTHNKTQSTETQEHKNKKKQKKCRLDYLSDW